MDFPNLKTRGFTLVELIIVITILAILSTVAFISFQGFTKDARDANRLTSLTSIENSLVLHQTKTQKYPDVDDGIEIQGSGGVVIGYQGYIGDNVSRLIHAQETPKDPLDDTKYIYSINAGKNKYQLMTFMEGDDYKPFVLLGVGKALADFSTRHPKLKGDNLGIILDTNNNPITQNIDVENYSGNALKAIIKDNYKIEGTGSVLVALKSTFKNGQPDWKYHDKNCPLPDVIIGNQVWAGCNSTLGNGFERGQTNANMGSNIYSGVIHSTIGCYKNHQGTNNVSDCALGSEAMISTANPKSWFLGTNSNGDGTYNTIWGKFYTWDNSSTACPAGRHVPTDEEWATLENYLAGSICRTGNGWQCTGLGWRRNGSVSANNLAEILKIPLAGLRYTDGSTFRYRGHNALLWSSTQDGATVYTRNFDRNYDTVYRNLYDKAYGFSVRCLKD